MVNVDITESEWQTRKRRIDPRLAAQGWKVVHFDATKPLADYQRQAVAEYETENGPADYALCLNGVILAVVEAKKLTLGPHGVLPQAERYSRGATANSMRFGEFCVPFVYS